jgi:hypothetical protein
VTPSKVLSRNYNTKSSRGADYLAPWPEFLAPYLGDTEQKLQYENGDNFFIRTPFLMILGSLESPQQALQLHP